MAPSFYRTRRGLTIALVAVLVVVIGVVGFLVLRPSAEPDAATPDGGGVAPTTNANGVVDPPVLLTPLSIAGLPADAPAPTPAGVEFALQPALVNPGLANYSAYVIDPTNDQVLFDRDGGEISSPASTMKLLTGAAVLSQLDPQSRLVTKVVQGPEPGTIVLVGGGDVTLSARAAGVDTVYEGAPTVAELAAEVLAKGVAVEKIVLDTTRWTGAELGPGWLTTDIGTETQPGYITRMSPLMVDGDRFRPALRDSGRTGDPARTAGRALALALGVPGAVIEEGGQAAPDAVVLGEVSSQPISVLLAQALENSDNVLAEALAREVAIQMGGAGSFDGVSASIQIALEDLGLDTTGVEIIDASGYSTDDKVPTRLLAEILALSVKSDSTLRDLVIGLPVAGASGTLVDRFKAPESAVGKGWIRAKTGSLGLTYALAGVVPDVQGRVLVFALISNGVDPTTRPAQDQFAAILRTCGCV